MSNKTINKSIFGLVIIAILALVPAGAHAQTVNNGYGDANYYSPSTYNNGYYTGTNYYNSSYYYTAAQPPVIYLISPSSVPIGSSGAIVEVDGNNFVPGDVAKLNGYDRPTTYINSGRLQMQLNSNDTAIAGNMLVTVYSPNAGQFSNAGNLSISGVLTSGTINYNPNTTTSGGYAPTRTVTIIKEVPATTTATSTTTSGTTTGVGTTTTDATTGSNQSANVLSSGVKNFLPSNIIQWIIFFILVLLAVVLWRMIYLNAEEKNPPMKHS